MRKYGLILLLLVFWGNGAFAFSYPKQEIRAIWLTTIYGLDWPSFPAINEASRIRQQEEICNLLDRFQEAHFNMIFLQVRLRGDVIYHSSIESVSKVFSGKYGVLPGYDPLAFVIEECHKRGMECHAWFVTFPVGNDKIVKEQGKQSVVHRYPKLCKRHNGEWYLDPGIPGTTDYIFSLVRELVTNYDIDGIQFDYIRYPEEAKKFPDSRVYRQYGNQQNLADWRRENINRMVERIYDWIKQVKPWVQVSSSPLGKYSRIEQVPNAGWTAYESVFQDPKKWMQSGKHDMIVPMMYYLHKDYFPFVDNWTGNAYGRIFVSGLGAYRLLKEEGDWALTDITDQIDYTRAYGGKGCAFFRGKMIADNCKGLYDELKNNYYKYPAQLPPLTWLNDSVPSTPEEVKVTREEGHLRLFWAPSQVMSQPLTYTVYYSQSDSVRTDLAESILATGVRDTLLYLPVPDSLETGFTFRVSASTRYHIESKPSKETYYYVSKFIK
ncbi:glycoside hydrolase family 10 protein [Parabacteroides sp. Marseille-P3160]|uniref:glycoside hydrolase family 10 protein n=1 Tax=Parabacteroides sp. Marseille-P3160 TaxID=1917887 RepID=UPI0009BA21EF|nr:family 10 glycosylhydrolase [Parabacteroides sp. Marseille-P3160]